MSPALHFIIRTLLDLYILTYILRFILQWVKADFHNPVSQFIVRVTNPLVVPLRRIIPGLGGLDMATLVVILALELAATAVLTYMAAGLLTPLPTTLLHAVLRMVTTVIQLYLVAILIQVVLSWVNPGLHSPVTSILWKITAPVLSPVRRLLPPIAGLDLSPLVVLIALQAVLISIPLPPWLA